jgi:hypothetical protein
VCEFVPVWRSSRKGAMTGANYFVLFSTVAMLNLNDRAGGYYPGHS